MTTPGRPVPFRAGRAVPDAGLAARLALPQFTGDTVLLADISEFEPDIADAAYLAWSKAIVIRAAYGAQHDDHAWYGGQRRDLLHAGGIRFLGIYQYVTAFEDPVAQADALARLIGALRAGEKIIGDFEEGTGNQKGRRDAWAREIGKLGDVPWTYSGLNFAAAHDLAPVDWVAAYGQAEPATPHTLWQFTDSFAVPGVGSCDCSLFHGTIGQLAALAFQSQQSQPVPAPFHGEYVTAGMLSLAGLAAKLGCPPSMLLRMTAVHYGTFGDALAGWINSVAGGTLPPGTPLPAGIRLWVS